MNDKMKEIVEWIDSMQDTRHVQGVRVISGKQTWEGAYYWREDVRQLFLLGDLPKSYGRSSQTAYNLPNSGVDWYVTCYMTNHHLLRGLQKVHYPFDSDSFCMREWTAEEPIDEHVPYRRVRILMERFI